jgi:hypothetical protein
MKKTNPETTLQNLAEKCTRLIATADVSAEDALVIVLNMLRYHSSLVMDPISLDAFTDGLKSLLRHSVASNCSLQSSEVSPDLYLALIQVPTGDLSAEDIFDAYLSATCVAAGIGFDPAFMDRIKELFHQQRVKTNDA